MIEVNPEDNVDDELEVLQVTSELEPYIFLNGTENDRLDKIKRNGDPKAEGKPSETWMTD